MPSKRDDTKKEWSLSHYLVYGGVGFLAGVAGYFFYEYYKDSAEQKKNRDVINVYRARRKSAAVELTSAALTEQEKCRKTIQCLINRIEFNFYRNQQIADVTALRGLENIRKHHLRYFDITALTAILRESNLTPAEKHQHFNQVKTFCFAKLLSVMYAVLGRLLLVRTQINILGRQWIEQLVLTTSSVQDMSPEDLKLLYEAIDGQDVDDMKKVISKEDPDQRQEKLGREAETGPMDDSTSTVSTAKGPSAILSPQKPSSSVVNGFDGFFSPGKRRRYYHPQQKPRLRQNHRCLSSVPPICGTDENLTPLVYSEAYYVFLSATRWSESKAGSLALASLVLEETERELTSVLPQHNVTLAVVTRIMENICNSVEKQLFKPAVTRTAPAAQKENMSHAESPLLSSSIPDQSNSHPVVLDNEELLIVCLFIPEWISTTEGDNNQTTADRSIQHIPSTIAKSYKNHDPNEEGQITSSQYQEAAAVSSDDFTFSCSSLNSTDERLFVQGCLAETRDILESKQFKQMFVNCRKEFLNLILSFIAEKLSARSTNCSTKDPNEGVPLCRLFGRLCGIADQLSVEIEDVMQQSRDSENCTSLSHKSSKSISGQPAAAVYETDNAFVNVFAQLPFVEDFCGAVYAPSLMLAADR